MFIFREPVRKRGSLPGNKVKQALEHFLDTSSPALIRVLVRYWKDQQTVLTYSEIRQAILDRSISVQMVKDWQQDYSKLVSEKIVPEWKNAMEVGAAHQMAHKGLDIGFKFNSDHFAVREWIERRTASLVTNSTQEQKNAIQALIDMGIQRKMSTSELEKYIRPCIGLTKPQAAANMRHYQTVKEKLRNDHPRMKEASIEKKARESSMKYADKQLRYRAKMIAETEKAMAYEYGRLQHTNWLVEEGYLPPQVKRWYTAEDGRVCKRCGKLHNKVVFMYEEFQPGVISPPLHPLCRCVTMYEDAEEAPTFFRDNINGNPLNDGLDTPNEKGMYSGSTKRIGNNDVDLDYINSNAFRRKFNKITENSNLNDKLRQAAIGMLTHRNGSDGEDMYIYDTKSSNLILRKTSSRKQLEVGLSKSETETIRKEYAYRSIGIHNHPTNIPPTGSDFAAAGYRKYKFGIVVTHNGRVFKYSVGNIPFVSSGIDLSIDKYTSEPYNMDIEKAFDTALNDAVERYGISWEEIK